MNKADRTKRFIIEKTAVIFNKKGYSGTSLSDMTIATGLTKGSIYGNFANKDEVAIAVYGYNSNALSQKIDLIVDSKDSAIDKLMAWVTHYRTNWKDEFAKGGCPILNAAIEADDNLPFLKSKVQYSISSWAEKLCKIIEAGQQDGMFKNDIFAADYAYIIITLVEGGIMLGKIMNDETHLFLALDRVTQIIEQEVIR